jgi:hypothetical protein
VGYANVYQGGLSLNINTPGTVDELRAMLETMFAALETEENTSEGKEGTK